MSEGQEPNPMTQKDVVYQAPGSASVVVARDVSFGGDDEENVLTADLYYPPGSPLPGKPLPPVVLVHGYPDDGFRRVLGVRFREMRWSVSWARSIAASGMAAITYTNREPVADLERLLAWIRASPPGRNLDGARVGLLASSGHAPLALWALMGSEHARSLHCAALAYPYTLDLDGSSAVARAAEQLLFVHPAAELSPRVLPTDRPLFLARAGRDELPGLNEALDRFVAKGLARNLPLTCVNHPDAPHAFDLFHESEESRELVRGILSFLRFHLLDSSR